MPSLKCCDSGAFLDGFVKSHKTSFSVILTKVGILSFQLVQILWIPIFTGVTTFYDSIFLDNLIFHEACPKSIRACRQGRGVFSMDNHLILLRWLCIISLF